MFLAGSGGGGGGGGADRTTNIIRGGNGGNGHYWAYTDAMGINSGVACSIAIGAGGGAGKSEAPAYNGGDGELTSIMYFNEYGRQVEGWDPGYGGNAASGDGATGEDGISYDTSGKGAKGGAGATLTTDAEPGENGWLTISW